MIDAKPHRRWCVANGIDERGEQIDAFPTICRHPFQDEGHDGVGPIFTRHDLRKLCVTKVGTRQTTKNGNLLR